MPLHTHGMRWNMLRRSLLLASLSVLASCASQPRLIQCAPSEPLPPELTEPPPPPGWFSRCLRQITDSPKIDDDCLERLRPWLMNSPP